ncbi:hypothetical protein BDV93DRAFT_567384 [Ceratobasidium sp. AG-I]|nr:hypothetical protein BDV93DRAFT_567384 [Ceratobasidium sp. AG-I]
MIAFGFGRRLMTKGLTRKRKGRIFATGQLLWLNIKVLNAHLGNAKREKRLPSHLPPAFYFFCTIIIASFLRTE